MPPYTYSNLLKYIDEKKKAISNNNIISEEVLTKSLGGVNIPLLTITDY